MKITNVRINGIENPIGFRYDYLSCSWNVEDAAGKMQTNAKIEVSESPDFSSLLYKKEGINLNQGGEKLDIILKPRTTYYYRITVVSDAKESALSDVHIFETGKMDEVWMGKWISPAKEDKFHPILEKNFLINKAVRRARLYITGVGLFEAYVDGKKLGNEYLTPYTSDYEDEIQVITLPLDSEILVFGEHSLSVMLGKGWYMGTFGLGLTKNNYGSRMAAIGELHIEYEDGKNEIITTDKSWNYYESDIEDSGIYLGEIINRDLYTDNKNMKKQVEVLEHPEANEETRSLLVGHLQDRTSLPVIEKERIAVKEIINTPVGETILDMGQNFAGFIEFKANFDKGTEIILDFGEILQQDNFYNANYRDANSQFVYISDGREETVRPHFTFFGFRYVRIKGWPDKVKKEDFTGIVIYSDLRRSGYIETSDDKINRLYQNTLWGLKSNFIDLPTDCPQRSERLGWTGDAQVFAPTASYHMDTRAFFHKFIKDLALEQKKLGGAMPNFLPNIGHTEKAGSVWGDIATFLPNTLYKYYGNKDEMEYCYPLMKNWVKFIDRKDGERGKRRYLFDFMDTFGDWLALDGSSPTSFKGSTDDVFISTAYYYHSTHIVKKTAENLGKSEDADYFSELEDNIRLAIFNEFFTPSGRLAIDTQAAYVIALKFGLYNDKEKLINQFKIRLKKDMYSIKCGFVGAPLICTVLAEIEEYETAYDFLLKEDFPSWLYSVNLGATTVWERWNSVMPDGTISDTGMNSLNHYAYGSVMEFVYAYVGGIRPAEAGFRKALIEPHPDIRIPEVRCRYESVSGPYECKYKICEDGKIKAHIKIPFGCEAEVKLPGYEKVSMILSAGEYDFCYKPKVDFRKPYGRHSNLLRIRKDVRAIDTLKKYTPALAGIAMSGNPEICANSLEDISHITFLPYDADSLENAIREISEIIVC